MQQGGERACREDHGHACTKVIEDCRRRRDDRCQAGPVGHAGGGDRYEHDGEVECDRAADEQALGVEGRWRRRGRSLRKDFGAGHEHFLCLCCCRRRRRWRRRRRRRWRRRRRQWRRRRRWRRSDRQPHGGRERREPYCGACLVHDHHLGAACDTAGLWRDWQLGALEQRGDLVPQPHLRREGGNRSAHLLIGHVVRRSGRRRRRRRRRSCRRGSGRFGDVSAGGEGRRLLIVCRG